jgi:hypothetical protein
MTIESKNTVLHDAEDQREPIFWAVHPLLRGIVTGIMYSSLSNFFPPKALFRSGFAYGVLSGISNVGIRSALDQDTPSPEKKALNYFAAATLPWVSSASLMHQLYKRGGNGFFRLSPSAAMLAALCVEASGDTNKDLYQPKK